MSSLPLAKPDSAAPTAPITGWDRAAWAALADKMLLAVRPYASPGHARIVIPGAGRGFGSAVDGLEGFARTFLLAGFRLVGENGTDPLGLAGWYARGLAAGTDPNAPDSERWVRMSEDMQAKVEAASIALVLDLTRPWIWDKLTPDVQQNVIAYFSEAVGDETFIKNNWLWFRLIIQTFLRSVGGPYSLAEMQADLAQHDSYYRGEGWYSDGEPRAYDHYEGWAMHLYPTLWGMMRGAQDLAEPRRATDRARLARYLQDAIRLVGADGAPLIEGRSLTYRFASAAPYWLGALVWGDAASPDQASLGQKPPGEMPSGQMPPDQIPLGQLRRAAAGVLDYFYRHGAPDANGLLNIGWFEPWLPLAQGYSGPSSPYWAVKGMLGLLLSADHPAWLAVEEPLPIERSTQLFAIPAAGWLVSSGAELRSGTVCGEPQECSVGTNDGIVRIYNHGSDNAFPDSVDGDSPLYARQAYSTATFPWLDAASWESPADNMVGLVDKSGRMTHRAGFKPLYTLVLPLSGERTGIGGGEECSSEYGRDISSQHQSEISSQPGQVGIAASTWTIRWLDQVAPEQSDSGRGLAGEFMPAGKLTVISVVQGARETRWATVESLQPGLDASTLRLRFTGWPTVTGDGLRAKVQPVGLWAKTATAGVLSNEHPKAATPFAAQGQSTQIPYIDYPVTVGAWFAAEIVLERL